MNELLTQALSYLFKAIILALTGVVTYYIKTALVPWLQDKQLYTTVQRFVQAAEKMGKTGAIPKDEKKAYVVSMLHGKGIIVTPEVEAFIESAVTELDNMASEIIGVLGDAADVEEPDPGPKYEPPDTEA